MSDCKKAIVIGAASGIGRELVKKLIARGYCVGLVDKKNNLLVELQKQIPENTFVKCMDLLDPLQAMRLLEELIQEMRGLDLLVISAAVASALDGGLDWEKESEVLGVNVDGFAAMANVGMRHFLKQGFGHLAGFSSVQAVRGNPLTPAYSASKAFVSNYLEGLRFYLRVLKSPVAITEVCAGYVQTDMLSPLPAKGLFWVVPVDKAAEIIIRAIEKKRAFVYVSRRWSFVAFCLRHVPEKLMVWGARLYKEL